MKRIKFLFPVILVALFATSAFAQPKAINLEKVKMNADIAKELNAIIKANKSLLNTMDADAEKSQKMEWREELRGMYGWYNDKSKDQEVAFIKDQMKKAAAKAAAKQKRIVTPVDITGSTIALVPRVVEDKGGKTTTVYQQFSTTTQGINGKKFPQGTVLLNIQNAALKSLNLTANQVPTPAQAQGIIKGQQAGIKQAITKLMNQSSDSDNAAGGLNPKALQTLGKKLVTNLNNVQYVPVQSQPIDPADVEPDAPAKIDPADIPPGIDPEDVSCASTPRPNPRNFDNEDDFNRALIAWDECQNQIGANQFITVQASSY